MCVNMREQWVEMLLNYTIKCECDKSWALILYDSTFWVLKLPSLLAEILFFFLSCFLYIITIESVFKVDQNERNGQSYVVSPIRKRTYYTSPTSDPLGRSFYPTVYVVKYCTSVHCTLYRIYNFSCYL